MRGWERRSSSVISESWMKDGRMGLRMGAATDAATRYGFLMVTPTYLPRPTHCCTGSNALTPRCRRVLEFMRTIRPLSCCAPRCAQLGECVTTEDASTGASRWTVEASTNVIIQTPGEFRAARIRRDHCSGRPEGVQILPRGLVPTA